MILTLHLLLENGGPSPEQAEPQGFGIPAGQRFAYGKCMADVMLMLGDRPGGGGCYYAMSTYCQAGPRKKFS